MMIHRAPRIPLWNFMAETSLCGLSNCKAFGFAGFRHNCVLRWLIQIPINYILIIPYSKQNKLRRKTYGLTNAIETICTHIRRWYDLIKSYGWDDILYKIMCQQGNIYLHVKTLMEFLAFKNCLCSFDDTLIFVLVLCLKSTSIIVVKELRVINLYDTA